MIMAWGEWTMLGGQMHIYPAMGEARLRLISPTSTRIALRWAAVVPATASWPMAMRFTRASGY